MKTIHKYPLETTDSQEISMSKGHKPLYVGFDGNYQLCLWAMIDDNAKKTKCTIYVVGTGNPLPDAEMDYIGSVKDDITTSHFTFIWHIFIGK
jgi:hypothetical protein